MAALFLTGMTGALAPFNYLVVNSCNFCVFCKIFLSSKLDLFAAACPIIELKILILWP